MTEINTDKEVKFENCSFTNLKIDKKALESMRDISKALLNLTELLKSSLEEESLININRNSDDEYSDDE